MREDRKIIFEYDEVYKAIFSLCSVKDIRRPPAGQVQTIIEKPGEDKAIVMHVKTLDETRVAEEEYSHDFVAAALLTFCRGMGVPIPKKARKSILITPTNVVMRVEI